jgi:uncharacterized membrane protein YeiB
MDLSSRQPGPDVTRALAMAGVITMNYHGYLIINGASRDGGWAYDFFDPWTGPLSTRFAATFVLVAGIGVTLLTRSSLGNRSAIIDMRWKLIRRGLLLYGFGLFFDFVWNGTILPFYGVMLIIAAVLFTVRIRWLLCVGSTAAVAGWGIHWWLYERTLDGLPTDFIDRPGPRSPKGLLLNAFVNGTHPLLPWLAFFCTGIVVGRLLAHAWWRPAVAATGLVLFAAATIVASLGQGERSSLVLSNDPFDRGIVYVASALGTALLAFTAITWVADRFVDSRPIDALRRAGQMSLTLYIAHALVFNLLVNWLDLIQPGGLRTALTMAAAYWLVATAGAVAYQHRYGRGPTERLYRRLAG